MSGVHAFLPPSGAPAWERCALWPTMNQLYPELGDKQPALEGEASHWAFAEILRDVPVALGQIAPNNVTLNEEMIEGAEFFVECVDARPAAGWELVEAHVEETLQNAAIHELNWGTPDYWELWHDQTRGAALVRLSEYKFGHDYVEVFENMQLLNQLALILEKCDMPDKVLLTMQGDVFVEFGVTQPRSYHRDGAHRVWKAKARDLVPYFERLRRAAAAALEPNPMATPGPQCEHCPGRYACQPLARGAYIAVDLSQRSAPVNLPVDAASLELRMLEHYKNLLDARVTGLQEQVEHALRGGQSAPFQLLKPSTSRTVWLKPEAEVIALGQLCGHDLGKQSVVTPTQAVKAGVPKELVAAYSHTPPGKLKLVPDDGSAARKIFGFNPT